MPLYWRLLGDVRPFELTVHRVLWCAVFVVLVTVASGNIGRVLAITRSARLMAILALTSVLISTNWGLFIYCVETDQLVDASLGYYMTPLLSFALGVAFFGERLSRFRMAAVVLAGAAVIIQAIGIGHFPWIAPALAVSFGFYGYFRKLAPVAALDGLLVETVLLFPVTLALVAVWALNGKGAFPSHNILKDAFLIGGGPLTAVPLALFAAGARRVRMSTLGLLQYVSPSITLLLAIFGFHEAFTISDGVAFAFVWAALVLTVVEGRVARIYLHPSES
jgi:chloramphenicol-sensitive protein RarD